MIEDQRSAAHNNNHPSELLEQTFYDIIPYHTWRNIVPPREVAAVVVVAGLAVLDEQRHRGSNHALVG